jgi:tRNA A37 methylthiotransferase MiaB
VSNSEVRTKKCHKKNVMDALLRRGVTLGQPTRAHVDICQGCDQKCGFKKIRCPS